MCRHSLSSVQSRDKASFTRSERNIVSYSGASGGFEHQATRSTLPLSRDRYRKDSTATKNHSQLLTSSHPGP